MRQIVFNAPVRPSLWDIILISFGHYVPRLPHKHRFMQLGEETHAEIVEGDPVQHTSFILLGCPICRRVEYFPSSNAVMCTDRFMARMKDELRDAGWKP